MGRPRCNSAMHRSASMCESSIGGEALLFVIPSVERSLNYVVSTQIHATLVLRQATRDICKLS